MDGKRELLGEVCPAHAGMSPANPAPTTSSPSLPRTRGDEPVPRFHCPLMRLSAPHTRG